MQVESVEDTFKMSQVLQPQKIELLLRISLQNLLLILATTIFAGLAALAIAQPTSMWLFACVHAASSLSLLVQWCHHGARTAQIKGFLLDREAALPDTWERWLPINRPRRLLGNRWLISTKGVFLGLQAAMLILGVLVRGLDPLLGPALCLAVFAASAGLLFTNPKE